MKTLNRVQRENHLTKSELKKLYKALESNHKITALKAKKLSV